MGRGLHSRDRTIVGLSTHLRVRRTTKDIAWETDVWCADNPTHLIHFNGERFLGPYN
ncbi:BsuBI/PstI family type II restriction endonuclease [Streptomyces sp. NPDC048277]|uniref:BsuBI/PstI family type II restriction endonuclease n=1 Tax=Streptomyces sp. NPDC048277 TaxID=3155027 RepID=UPI0034113446